MVVNASPNVRRDFFETTASFWEAQYRNRGLRGRGVQERTALGVSAMLANRSGADGMVLDLGAGPGIAADQIASRGAAVCAVDFCEHLLTRAQTRLKANGRQRAFVVRADAHHLPFADGTFEGALCIALVTWVQEPERVLRELARVLKPGSMAVLTCRTLYYCGDFTDPVFWMRRLLPARLRNRVRAKRRQHTQAASVEPHRFTIRRMNRLLRDVGLDISFWRTLQYGDFRMFRRSILPMRWQLAFNNVMERLWRFPLVRRMGWTYYVHVKVPDATAAFTG